MSNRETFLKSAVVLVTTDWRGATPCYLTVKIDSKNPRVSNFLRPNRSVDPTETDPAEALRHRARTFHGRGVRGVRGVRGLHDQARILHNYRAEGPLHLSSIYRGHLTDRSHKQQNKMTSFQRNMPLQLKHTHTRVHTNLTSGAESF